MSAAGYRDGARWEQVQRLGEQSVKSWIERQLKGASVTVVLIGQETSTRPWVEHEILRSHSLGMGLVGVRIHGLKNSAGVSDPPGGNPFDELGHDRGWGWAPLSGIYHTYDYVAQNGYQNLHRWIEEAARNAGR